MILNRFKKQNQQKIGHEFEKKKSIAKRFKYFDDENIREWIYPKTPTVNVMSFIKYDASLN